MRNSKLASQVLSAVLTSALVALAILLLSKLLNSGWRFITSQAGQVEHPAYMWFYLDLISASALGLLVILWCKRFWGSLQLRLIRLEYWVWVFALIGIFVLSEFHHFYSACVVLILAEILTLIAAAIYQRPLPKLDQNYLIDPDLPVPENGIDLLDRGEMINGLVSLIVRERPSVIALTGRYGDGKTSILNLTVGELKKRDIDQRPIIVRFSPWLPGNSNALVMSLLTSITAEIRRDYVVPGLSKSALQYGKTVLNMIPKAALIKDLLADMSQQESIKQLTKFIAQMPRRILVILDDLDRMQPRELEVVLKILRGSEDLSSVTFLCSFDEIELALILKSTRRFQDTGRFLKKFFQVNVAVPQIDSAKLKELFQAEMARIRPGAGGAG